MVTDENTFKRRMRVRRVSALMVTTNVSEIHRHLQEAGFNHAYATIASDMKEITKENFIWLNDMAKTISITEQEDRLRALRQSFKLNEDLLISGKDNAGKPLTAHGRAALNANQIGYSDEIRKCENMLYIQRQWAATQYASDPDYIRAALDIDGILHTTADLSQPTNLPTPADQQKPTNQQDTTDTNHTPGG